ncbi:uncharacterized protein MONBRDRAFT_9072 [Monosiga brevicollis MX1]|uniref:GRIP domain-containing protein n=1 Tax=Monosiga brevicollis TaxID=81824 RepID=A9V202_MONBE|nr:uncharacterized protein MONBRDRAFT_9072 [Monosiga brevicollis MX1]EDQ88655.1 predicted protein [Monosiga brevicollis MX1]|eukprot:XP_001746759.1 hypothetical protein [Monosiga brevicollis MX1]
MSWLSNSMTGLVGQVRSLTEDILTDESTDGYVDPETLQSQLQDTQRQLVELYDTAMRLQEERDRLIEGRDTAERRADDAESQIHTMSEQYRHLIEEKQAEIDTYKTVAEQMRQEHASTALADLAQHSQYKVDEDIREWRTRVEDLEEQLRLVGDQHQEDMVQLQQQHASQLAQMKSRLQEFETNSAKQSPSVSNRDGDRATQDVHSDQVDALRLELEAERERGQRLDQQLTLMKGANHKLREQIAEVEDELATALEAGAANTKTKDSDHAHAELQATVDALHMELQASQQKISQLSATLKQDTLRHQSTERELRARLQELELNGSDSQTQAGSTDADVTQQLQTRLADAEQQLAEMDEQLAVVEERLEDREQACQEAEKRAAAAEDRLQLQDAQAAERAVRAEAEVEACRLREASAQERIAALEHELRELEAQHQDLTETHATHVTRLEAELADARVATPAVEHGVAAELHAEIVAALEGQLEEQSAELEQMALRCEGTQQELQQALSDIDDLQRGQQLLARERNALLTQIEELQAESKKMPSATTLTQSEPEGLVPKLTIATQTDEAPMPTVEQAPAQVQEAPAHAEEISVETSVVEALREELQRTEAVLTAREEEIASLKSAVEKAEQQRARLQQHLLQIEEQRTQQQLELLRHDEQGASEARQEVERLQKEMTTLHARAETYRSRVASLEKKLSSTVSENEEARAQVRLQADELEQVRQEMNNLQMVLESFESEKALEIEGVHHRLRDELDALKTRAARAEQALAAAEQARDAAQEQLAAQRTQLANAQYDQAMQATLEHDRERLQKQVDDTKARLERVIARADEHLMDLTLLKNTIGQYFSSSEGPQREQVQDLLADLCDLPALTSRSARAASRRSQGLFGGWFGGSNQGKGATERDSTAPRPAPTGAVAEDGSASFSSVFVSFLMSHSQRDGAQPETEASTTGPSADQPGSTSQASANASTPSTRPNFPAHTNTAAVNVQSLRSGDPIMAHAREVPVVPGRKLPRDTDHAPIMIEGLSMSSGISPLETLLNQSHSAPSRR